MPGINLRGDNSDRAWVQAVMYFPGDDDLRNAAFARARAELSIHELGDAERLEVTAGTIRAILAAPSRNEFKPIREKAARAGLVAGDLLAMVYAMAITRCVTMPSINKAVHAYIAWGRSGVRFGDGKPLPKSESEVRKFWASHRAVAHFWAAIRLNNEFNYSGDRTNIFAEAWPSFLGVSAGLYRFGAEFIPERLKPPAPILNPDESWQLPSSIIPMSLSVNSVPTRLVELLKDYKAPQALY